MRRRPFREVNAPGPLVHLVAAAVELVELSEVNLVPGTEEQKVEGITNVNGGATGSIIFFLFTFRGKKMGRISIPRDAYFKPFGLGCVW